MPALDLALGLRVIRCAPNVIHTVVLEPFSQIAGDIGRTVLSAGSFLLIDFCLIFVPFGHYDEPEILRYAITSICPKGADVSQSTNTIWARGT